jgi:ankyrin repeat protein
MNINIKLFNYFNDHKWKNIINILNDNNNNIDINLRDNNNNYLIQYAILFNKIEIVDLLIKKGSKLDIIDTDGKSLLFIPIKYNFLNLLSILLKYNNNYIGESIINIKDNFGFTPLHYSINITNIDAMKIILKYKPNLNILDNNGNNALHLAIFKKNISLVRLLINTNININSRNKNGETALHIACNYQLNNIVLLLLKNKANPNIPDYDNNLTPILYSISLRNIEITELLLNYDANPNISDVNGNNSFYYSIKENIPYLINLFSKYNLNFNSFNIYGKSPLHIILDKYIDKIINIDEINFEFILKKTNINSQDNNGNTVLFLLIISNIWKNYIDILKNKILNIFLINNNNQKIIDVVNIYDKDIFINMVTDSYFNTLRKSNNNKWNLEWENLCNKILTKKNFKKKNPKLFKNIKNFKNNKDVCKDIIRFYIKHKNISFPLIKSKKYCVNIDDGIKVNFTTYIGDRLDILSGLLYVQNNYNNVTSSLNKNFYSNKEIKNYYESIGIDFTYDFLNFEIIWSFQNIFFPDNFSSLLNNFLKSNKRFFIIPLGIENNIGAHANILIYDKKFNEVERFEPNGNNISNNSFYYNYNLLDILLKNKFNNILPNCKYFSPNDFLPNISFQQFDSISKYKNVKIGDPGGFCSVWSIWYADMRIKYSDIPRNLLVLNLISKFREKNISFKNFIRNYTSNITNIRDSFLNKIDIDINDWNNQKFSSKSYKLLIEHIQKSI